jgi:hypothetical protein
MTIFDIISAIIFTKQKNCLTTVDDESVFSPYLVNRWLSMYSPELAIKSNIVNKYVGVFENKKDLLSLFFNCFPRVKSKRIQYIKKTKKDKEEIDEKIPLLAKSFELSQREINSYIAILKK